MRPPWRRYLTAGGLGHFGAGLTGELREVVVVGHDLFQMPHPLWPSGGHHDLAIVALDPEAGMAADIVAQVLETMFRVALAEVDGEHPPPRSSAEGRVLGVVIKADQVAWLSL